MTVAEQQQDASPLAGKQVALVGRFAAMGRREVERTVRGHGAVLLDQPSPAADLIVVGEADLAELGENAQWLDDALRAAVEAQRLQILEEGDLWQLLGMVDTATDNFRQLYTTAMLADLLKVPVSTIRRWHRRGLITPRHEVRRLAYFDFQEVATARQLAQLVAQGISPQRLEQKLSALARFLPEVERRLAKLSVLVEGRDILLRQGDGLIDSAGQRRFDFETPTADEPLRDEACLTFDRLAPLPDDAQQTATPEEMMQAAAALEDDGRLTLAAEMYRAVLAAAGPSAEVNFRLAELLYRSGEAAAARERYYAAIELDEDYVEARSNLGCVLAEQGQCELAAAAFRGALAYHPDYADVHYHLARTLDELDQRTEADHHWQQFLALAPHSPWAVEARQRLGQT